MRSQRGFTLMEVLVALLILAFSFSLVFGGLSASHRLMLKAKERAEVVDECAKRIQEARLLGDDLTDEAEEGKKLQGKGVWLELIQRPVASKEETYWLVKIQCQEKGSFSMEAPLP